MRKAKNEEWIRLGEEMEKDAKGMQKRFWSWVRAKEKETVTHIRGSDGKLRSGKEAMNRWKQHFVNLLNGDAGSGEEVKADGNKVRSDEGGIEVEEVERAVKKLKSGKAGGVCGIQVEMVKTGGYTVMQWLKDIFEIAWNCGKTIIVPIYKKSSRAECGNYRGISLLSVVGKISGSVEGVWTRFLQ